ncbi:MAG: acetyl/propionyl/methylcrotonyl-CoA carboxylase subunit alpha [Alphaproteobacteria bacterium]|nr:acetyl/propionyl/methylcrotonyl-CoA carboxylase subunit alpha [Alphaproteobacteria bacterium]
MFRTLLIANRGEIACRVMRTARRMGLRTVAVYSEADASAMHVAMADEAYLIGAASPRESYLRIDRVIEAAKKSGADAVHPGYGFLSENADFAEACAKAGIAFVGPPAAAMRAMGDKARSKALMEKAGVPLVPGYHGDDQAARTLQDAADRIGYPVLIKASAGGGGKGMKVVEHSADFAPQLASAKREAASSFGDDRVLIERYLTRPRHIEIQVFADRHGDCVYLFERDCSIQRRHQKVLEEAPAPGMTEERRRAMGEAAVAAARAVGYVGAGTIEFIAEPSGRFYFMEMNTRLQVEHPVTEMITGTDLVEWQLRVASGEALPLRQDQLRIGGHAIEARLYAEDPARDFLPSTGTLSHLRFPGPSEHVRVDTGVRQGDAISIHYDPMIAKLIVWDRDRPAALGRLAAALRGCEAVGLATNIAFLHAVATHPAYAGGEVDTGFIPRHRDALSPPAAPADDRALALAALALLLGRVAEAARHAGDSADPWSPWHAADGWRLNGDNHHTLRFRDPARGDSADVAVVAHFRRLGYALDLPGGRQDATGTLDADGRLTATLAGARVAVSVVRQGDTIVLIDGVRVRRLQFIDPLAGAAEHEGEGSRLQAPMPGKVTAVHVAAGARVKRGQALMVLEAMKMEHAIAAPADGTIKEIRFAAGEQVPEGAELIVFEQTE